MNNKITSINIPNDISGFFSGKNFKWANIPDFAIITGVNGSGKTQLLKYLHSILQSNQGSNTILGYSKSGEMFTSHDIHYQAAYQPPSVNEAIVQSSTIDNFKINKKNVILGLLNQFRQTKQHFKSAKTANDNVEIYSNNGQHIFTYQKIQYKEIKDIVE